MTYAQFLLTFVVVPVAVLAFAVHRRLNIWWFRGLPVVIALAVAYTGPWDHFIISEGVWGYPAGRVWGPTIGLVPLEEYGFFVLQTTFTSLVLVLFLPQTRSAGDRNESPLADGEVGLTPLAPLPCEGRGELATPSAPCEGRGELLTPSAP